MSLKYLELKNMSNKCSKIVFILHGYGADAKDLLSIAKYWQRFLPEIFSAYQMHLIFVKLTQEDLNGSI